MAQDQQAKLTYAKDKAKQWRWTFQAANGEIIAVSGEGYKQIEGARNGFKSFADSLVHNNYTIQTKGR